MIFRRNKKTVPVRRSVILHAHIFKNAGTTLDFILERNFGARFRDDREDSKMSSDPTYISGLLAADSSLKAISSHSLPLPVERVEHVDFLVMVLLRDPLLRIRSVYDFERKQKATTLGAQKAKELDFKDYVAWRLLPDVPPTIRNMQVHYLNSNSGFNKPGLHKERLEHALTYIEGNPLMGVVELFDQSMVVFTDALESTPFEIDFAYKKQNVTAKQKLTRDQKVENLKAELGGDLFTELMEKNQMDIQLYEVANAILKERFNKVRNAEEKLAQLRERSDRI